MSRSIGDLLKLSSGMAGAQAISLLSVPIITRLYLPEDYGYLGAYTNIAAFLLIVATGRYHLALVVSQDPEERRSLVQISLLLLLASTFLSLLLVVGLAESIEAWVGMPGLAALLWFWPVTNMVGSLFVLLQYWCTAHRLFGPLGASYAAEALLGAGTVIAAGLILGSTATWPIVARVVAACGGTLLLIALLIGVRGEGRGWLSGTLSWSRLRDVIARYKRFPLVTSPAAVLNTIALAGPPLILAGHFDSAVLAYFLIAERLLSIPLTVIGTSFGHVIYQNASACVGTDALKAALQEPLKRLIRIGYFGLGLIAVCGPTLFELLLGQAWRDAGLIAQILAFGAFFRLLAAPFTLVTGTLGRQDIDLRFNILLSIGRNLSVLLGAAYFGLTGALMLLAAVSALAYLYLLVRLFSVAETPLLVALRSMWRECAYQTAILLWVLFIELYFGGYHTVLAAVIGTLAWLLLLYRHDREIMQVLSQRGVQSE